MITDLRLQHFRSYGDESFELGPGVNIVVGPNASGKTNLLEAVLVLSVGKSYRGRDNTLVQREADWARVDAHTPAGSRTLKLETDTDTSLPGTVHKSFEIDDKSYKRLPASKLLPTVLFEPNHLQLMHGEPGLRRDFIDDLAEQLYPGFGGLRRRYKRTLQQRNALLKRGGEYGVNQLFAWNVRLSELGGQITERRCQILNRANERLSDLYSQLAKRPTKVSIIYQSSISIDNYGSSLLSYLERSTELDFARGFTGRGPHRDDLVAAIDGKPANEQASRGELRTLVLTLKIIELQLLEEARSVKPLLLLDDVFSELDGARRRALTAFLQPYQTFITTTDADVVVQHFADNCTVIPLI